MSPPQAAGRGHGRRHRGPAGAYPAAPADLAFLRYGGDLLDRATAERTVAWLLAALDDPATFATRTSPSYDVRLRLIDTLAGVVPAAPPAARDAVINLMTTLPAQGDQAHATSWARVGYALPEDSWTASAAMQLLARSSGDHWALLNLARVLAAPHDPGTRASLLSEVR